MDEMSQPPDGSSLPYADEDCVAAFLLETQAAPLWQCVHLAEFPQLGAARFMHQPEAIVCVVCAEADDSPLARGCHCCGVHEPCKTVLLAVSTSGVRCAASLCRLCLSLVPPRRQKAPNVSP